MAERIILYGPNGAVLFPSAVAAAGDLANPTAPQTLSHLFGYDAVANNWNRARTGLDGLGNVGSGEEILAVIPTLIAGTGDYRAITTTNRLGDADAGSNTPAQHPLLWNGASYDRRRNNIQATLLASAARTTTQTSASIVNYNGSGIRVILDMTSPGTGSVTVTIDGVPNVGANYNILTGAAITTTSVNVYEIGPALVAVANSKVNSRLPRTFIIVVTANNANSATYSVAYDIG